MQTDRIVHTLEEKYKLFRCFLEISERMCTESADLLKDNMDSRLHLQSEIEKADAQLRELYKNAPGAEEAAKNRCDYSSLSPENKRIYDAAMKVHGILYQIQQMGPLLKKHMLEERSSLLKKLEDTQKSTASAANRYYQAAHFESPVLKRHFGFKKA